MAAAAVELILWFSGQEVFALQSHMYRVTVRLSLSLNALTTSPRSTPPRRRARHRRALKPARLSGTRSDAFFSGGKDYVGLFDLSLACESVDIWMKRNRNAFLYRSLTEERTEKWSDTLPSVRRMNSTGSCGTWASSGYSRPDPGEFVCAWRILWPVNSPHGFHKQLALLLNVSSVYWRMYLLISVKQEPFSVVCFTSLNSLSLSSKSVRRGK